MGACGARISRRDVSTIPGCAGHESQPTVLSKVQDPPDGTLSADRHLDDHALSHPRKGNSMTRPIIGITVDNNDNETCYESPYAYATAVEKGGGLPILLPYRADLSLVSQYADLIDGMLFSGG